jgi:hypothetical protein
LLVVLLTDKRFLLGKWIQDARAKANGTAESDLFEVEFRNQVCIFQWRKTWGLSPLKLVEVLRLWHIELALLNM